MRRLSLAAVLSLFVVLAGCKTPTALWRAVTGQIILDTDSDEVRLKLEQMPTTLQIGEATAAVDLPPGKSRAFRFELREAKAFTVSAYASDDGQMTCHLLLDGEELLAGDADAPPPDEVTVMLLHQTDEPMSNCNLTPPTPIEGDHIFVVISQQPTTVHLTVGSN